MIGRAFCSSGRAEGVKGTVHAIAGVLLGIMAVYNAAAFLFRRERHLGINAAVYTGLTYFEVRQTRRHWRRT